jgi:hypothetical protein
MQYEYFVVFFINVLIDTLQENIVDIDFPIFDVNTLEDIFILSIYTSPKKLNQYSNKDYKLYHKSKYISILKSEKETIFLYNGKKNIKNLLEYFMIENRIILQKILKTIFEHLFLNLHFDNSKKFKLDYYQNNIFIFYLIEL